MLRQIIFPDQEGLEALVRRPVADDTAPSAIAAGILRKVRTGGDRAVREISARFTDMPEGGFFGITDDEWEAAELVSEALKEAMETAIANIRSFHAAQLPREIIQETVPGVICRLRSVPLGRVGLYIPGGKAPLCSTLLMLAIPALIAGCREIVVCTPAGSDGKVPAGILYAAKRLGIRSVYRIGGAQAIGAMAYGTESIPAVDKIFGPGNAYVTAAKQLVQAEGVAIDMPAGPSEVAVLADETCVPAFVAADLLAQAEHSEDAQVLLVSSSRNVLLEVNRQLEMQAASLPRAQIIRKSLAGSSAVLVRDMKTGVALVNRYAPEHLIIACRNEEEIADQIVNAGSIFVGAYAPESAGDYASGTNHTLPTGGAARAWSGVTTASFMKTITIQQLTRDGLAAIAPAITVLARAESLEAHAAAVEIRFR